MKNVSVSVDINGNPTVYSKQPVREYWELDDKNAMDLTYYPVKGKMIEALTTLHTINHDRALLEGNRIYSHDKTVYIGTATGQALWRRGLASIWEEQSYVKQTFIEITQAGIDWLRDNTPKQPKKLTKRQQQREVDHLLDVLRNGR